MYYYREKIYFFKTNPGIPRRSYTHTSTCVWYYMRYVLQGSPSGGTRMPPGGDASRKALRLNQKKRENRRLRDRIPKRDIVERTRVIEDITDVWSGRVGVWPTVRGDAKL